MDERVIRFPAEWERQSAILLTWPHENTDWQENLWQVETVFIDVVRHLARYQTVIVSCFNKAHRQHIEKKFHEARIPEEQYILCLAKSNDSWSRDHGPITVYENNRPLLLDFSFNGWGNKYPFDLDNMITRCLYKEGVFRDTPLKTIDYVLEGGSVDSDGLGTIITTSQCLLAETRNPSFNRKDIEDLFEKQFGVSRIIWIKHSRLAGDDTDGHIDMLVRFINKDTLVYTSSKEPGNSNYQELIKLERELKNLSAKYGTAYSLIPLPTPVIRDAGGQQLPATYINFLFCNEQILVPTYNHVMDTEALTIISELVPDREVVGINSLPLIQQHGGLHCITMQLPEGVIK